MFKAGQLCTIVRDGYNSNLPDQDIAHRSIYVEGWNDGLSFGDLIPEGTPVLVIQSLENHCIALIGEKLYFIKNEALDIL
jgi:hypothetical protein